MGGVATWRGVRALMRVAWTAPHTTRHTNRTTPARHHRVALGPGWTHLVPEEAPIAARLPRPAHDHLLGPVGGQQLPLQRA